MTSARRVAILRGLTRQVAYRFWLKRGRPFGSPEVDWFHAEILVDRLRSIWSLETSDASSVHDTDTSETQVASAEVPNCAFEVHCPANRRVTR
jgi:DUF2934 family protein